MMLEILKTKSNYEYEACIFVFVFVVLFCVLLTLVQLFEVRGAEHCLRAQS